ncbi:hypothetical protein RR48_09874 [Papilio machaon]|uniref:Uncharacterized protein n=1 Tax=Papilio machaon TaxID=76193 RepID=A0A194R2L3_PAPMA|nr:hypothetical protein RR48_09874 [Papilio machaon]
MAYLVQIMSPDVLLKRTLLTTLALEFVVLFVGCSFGCEAGSARGGPLRPTERRGSRDARRIHGRCDLPSRQMIDFDQSIVAGYLSTVHVRTTMRISQFRLPRNALADVTFNGRLGFFITAREPGRTIVVYVILL